MKILVFGGSGFIGRHIVQEFENHKHEVRNFDNWNHRELLSKYYEYHRGNTLEQNDVKMLFRELDYSPDIIINLAATASISECNFKPVRAFRNNILSNINILNYVDKKFIYASSLYAQSNKSGAYGLTKRHSEEWIKYFAEKYKFPYVILRFGTVYGVGAGTENSIRNLVKEALETKVISYYGTGNEVRSYIHVKDVARYVREIALTDKYDNKTLNLMGHESMKSGDLLKLLKDILGDSYEIETRHEASKHKDHYEVTPYDYNKEDSYTYVSDTYTDLGSGLLEVIKELDEK